MFTGIVETTAIVNARTRERLEVTPQRVMKNLAVGESVAVDGVCLTVHQLKGRRITFWLSAETVRASTLGQVHVGDPVNLERALRVGDRLGGHLLLGHVDGRGRVGVRKTNGASVTMEIKIPERLMPMLSSKGPIAVDGVSLTLDPELKSDRIRVHLIPTTLKETTLGDKPQGAHVNLEVDVIAKYLRGILS